MPIDYHVHLERDDHIGECRFNRGRILQYVEAARARGLKEIAVTEHCYRFRQFKPVVGPLLEGEGSYPEFRGWAEESFGEDLDQYVEALVAAKEEGLPVKVGLEVDWVPGREEEVAAILRPYPWDVLLGSVHFLGKWCIDYSAGVGWPEKDVDHVFATYYETLAEAAASGLFDVLAHPDLVKKFGHRPTLDLGPYWRAVAEAAKGAGCCVEISTAGLHKPVGEIYPSLPFLRVFHEAGVPITLASDAHEPGHVGRDVEEAVRWAREAGYREVVLFEGRKQRREPLPERA